MMMMWVQRNHGNWGAHELYYDSNYSESISLNK